MKGGFGLTAVAAVALFTGAQQATSEGSVCAPRDELVSQLGHQFDENQKALGLVGEQVVMEVFASENGSWTILTTDINGQSCIVAAGEGWEDTFASKVGQGV
ncbi:hypothetical protein [Chelativorans salis]|uniref:Uncharacterized protein n=1 Tax=Chelativorans salis TaxID=2978478 RepID=A0ABT2LPS5_9HYPH|nr:hypothetical protein [Chelativorans sp. EGI FJ00035]MCT7376553.1 hypothetical protein [Chelativorans sp. EGI FJ00035]